MTFRISGMDCVEEVAVLRREVGPLLGGADRIAFDVLGGKMIVLGVGAPVAGIVAAVGKTGMVATPEGEPQQAGEGRDWRTVFMVASGACAAAGAGRGTAFVLPKAWFSLRRVRPDMNLLMVVAIGGAVGIGGAGRRVRGLFGSHSP